MTDVTNVRVGFVGLRNIAQLHADGILGLGGQVVAGTDVSRKRARCSPRITGRRCSKTTPRCTNWSTLSWSRPQPLPRGVRGVCTRGRARRPRGETPRTHARGAQNIADAAREAQGFCMVGFHNRFWGPVQVLNSYREQKLGDVTHVRANYLRRRGVPGRGSWFTRKRRRGRWCRHRHRDARDRPGPLSHGVPGRRRSVRDDPR